MLLTVDVGNSNIVAGIWKDERLVASWRIHTVSKKTEDEYATIFRSLFQDADLDPLKVNRVCLSSVVPSLSGAMAPCSNGSPIKILSSSAREFMVDCPSLWSIRTR